MTLTFPETLRPLAEELAGREGYSEKGGGLGTLTVALIIWDVYCRKSHVRTGPIVQSSRHQVETYCREMAERRGHRAPRAEMLPHRFSVRLPEPVRPLLERRMAEEGCKSRTAYVTSLLLYALDPDVPAGKGIPHRNYLVPLMHDARWVQHAVFAQLAKDFGQPQRKWPKDLGKRPEEARDDQMKLL